MYTDNFLSQKKLSYLSTEIFLDKTSAPVKKAIFKGVVTHKFEVIISVFQHFLRKLFFSSILFRDK